MREIQTLTCGWRFTLADMSGAEAVQFDDSAWEEVAVPHDWAIRGPFSPENDPQPMETSIMDYHGHVMQIGRTGGLPVVGVGWYRLALDIPDTYEHYALEFDGIMSRGEVYINGHKLAFRPYGYSSFSVDITSAINKGAVNIIAVKANARPATNRWYAGAGLYRPVRLVMTGKAYISYNGIWVKPDYDAKANTANIEVICETVGAGNITHTLLNPDGCAVTSYHGDNISFTMNNPRCWDIDQPVLYTLMTQVEVGGEITDCVFTRFGVRSIRFDKDEGFCLNERPLKIKGVCMHHDAGMLGAAYNRNAVLRQLMSLKEMGCNALRTTHNPPQPDTLDICDELGLLVMDEAFDEWTIPKPDNGYASYFNEWAERDLTDMIRRDRNHPSVIIYSIGNEIPDQTMPEGRETCRWLTAICHREDPTRPVTCCFSRPDAAVANGLTEEIDVVGINYNASNYERFRAEHPGWIILGSETESCVSSRGEYLLPAEMEMPVVKRDNLQVNSFDMSAPAYCYIPDIEFEAQDKCPYVCGSFVWTGYDYLGEPTPYRTEWPSRSSYFGIFDLAGLPKNRYWAYAANWGGKPVLHLFPHWNWSDGELVDVHCYTNLERVKLYLNGHEISDKKRESHRIIFGKIPFEAGALRAVGYNETGEIICEDVVKTAGVPDHIELRPEKTQLSADGNDLCYVEVTVVDKNGVTCPNADNEISFKVEGAGSYVASDAGDATSTRVFAEPYCNAFHGKLVMLAQAGTTPGRLMITAQSEGLRYAFAAIRVI